MSKPQRIIFPYSTENFSPKALVESELKTEEKWYFIDISENVEYPLRQACGPENRGIESHLPPSWNRHFREIGSAFFVIF